MGKPDYQIPNINCCIHSNWTEILLPLKITNEIRDKIRPSDPKSIRVPKTHFFDLFFTVENGYRWLQTQNFMSKYKQILCNVSNKKWSILNSWNMKWDTLHLFQNSEYLHIFHIIELSISICKFIYGWQTPSRQSLCSPLKHFIEQHSWLDWQWLNQVGWHASERSKFWMSAIV